MSLLTLRGGTPQIVRATVTTAQQQVVFRGNTNFLKIRSDVLVYVFFNQADATGGVNYVEVPAAISGGQTYGEWEGPADVPSIWLQTPTGTAHVEIAAFKRLG